MTKAVKCGFCGLLVQCDGDPGVLGAVVIPGNHKDQEVDGFALPMENAHCPGSEMLGTVVDADAEEVEV